MADSKTRRRLHLQCPEGHPPDELDNDDFRDEDWEQYNSGGPSEIVVTCRHCEETWHYQVRCDDNEKYTLYSENSDKWCNTPEKLAFGTEEDALGAAEGYGDRHNTVFGVYKCDCGRWHMRSI